MGGLLGVALWLSCQLVTSGALAQIGHELPLDACVEHLNDEQVDQQLAFVEQSLAKQRVGATLWWTGWNGFNVFNLTFGFYKYATTDTRLAKDSWLVSAIGAGLFVANVSLLPLPGMYGYRRLSKLSADTPAQRRLKLRKGISLLDKAARVENANSNWVAHLIGFLYAAVSTGYVWVRNPHADELTLALVLQFVTSLGVAELTFWTVPRRARRDLKVVRESVCDPMLRTARAPGPERSLKLHFFPGQLSLVARF
ncbi:MAG: hypothetical protein QM778_23890 [Myxococcales bacterium]